MSSTAICFKFNGSHAYLLQFSQLTNVRIEHALTHHTTLAKIEMLIEIKQENFITAPFINQNYVYNFDRLIEKG